MATEAFPCPIDGDEFADLANFGCYICLDTTIFGLPIYGKAINDRDSPIRDFS